MHVYLDFYLIVIILFWSEEQVEKAKQDDALSELSNILGDLKDMAIDMGSEIDRSVVLIRPHKFFYNVSSLFASLASLSCWNVWLDKVCFLTCKFFWGIIWVDPQPYLAYKAVEPQISNHEFNLSCCSQNKKLDNMQDDVDVINFRMREVDARGRCLLGK